MSGTGLMTDDAASRSALEGATVHEALVRVTRVLDAAGADSAARDARLLVAAALRATTLDLIREPGRRIDSGEAGRLCDLVARRIAREPVSRILGMRAFYGRTFRVTPATLDPRPATETLIDAALAIAERESWRSRPIRILDVGTGTGALLLTLLAELPLATGLGTDISDAALDVARGNAELLGVGQRSTFARMRSLDGVQETFDLMVSNPPYIRSGDIAGLDAEVRNYDPREALDGGTDGLAIYRELAAGLTTVLPVGWAIVEAGAGQARDIGEILRLGAATSHAESAAWADLEGHTRAVAVRTQLYPRR